MVYACKVTPKFPPKPQNLSKNEKKSPHGGRPFSRPKGVIMLQRIRAGARARRGRLATQLLEVGVMEFGGDGGCGAVAGVYFGFGGEG